jgi:hypothetical protein
MYRAAINAIRRGRLELAEEAFTRLIKHSPSLRADAHMWRAVVRFELGNDVEVLADVEQAQRLGSQVAARPFKQLAVELRASARKST